MEYYDIIDDSSSILLGCRTARSLSSVPEIGGCEGDENCNCSDGSHQDGDGSTITAGARIDDTSSSIFPPNYDESRVSSSNHNHQYNNSNDNNQRSKSRRKRMYHWWTDILSRVSRSASSLLNQHTPKLDDIFDTGDHENSQLADVSQLRSQQRHHNPLDAVQSSNSSANSISRRGGNSRLLRPGREESNAGRNNGNSDTNCNDDDEKNETIIALQEEIALLKQRVHTLEYKRDEELWHGGENVPASLTKSSAYKSESINDIPYPLKPVLSLTPDQITRYSRQLLLNDGFGIVGQCKLLSSSILVIGAGGIGSTVLLYLAAVGVGHITVVDYDTIEMSNLHRQIIHKDVNATSKKKKKSNTTTTTTTNKGHKVASDEEMRRGMLNNKAISAKYAMLELNPTLSCTALTIAITATNAFDLISKHDVIVDASDNPQTRYIINDACILANKPLVSGSAMGTEGQLTVYNYQPTATATATANAGSDDVTPTSSAENNNDNRGGRGISCSTKQQQQRTACYRCLYPKSTTTDGCKSCSDNGVLGMVPGVIGILQAVEVIKILTDIGHVMHDQLVMYDSLHGTFMNIKKPPPRINCAICSIAATITTMEESEQSLLSIRGPSVSSSTTLIPSTTTCPLGDGGGGGTAKVQSISCIEYNNNVRNIGQPHILLDVRVPRQYEMCSLDGSINLPLEELESQLDTMVGGLSHGQLPIYCLCRRGIASTDATRIIQKSINDGNAAIHSVYNIAGGLQSWVDTVDSDFPEY